MSHDFTKLSPNIKQDDGDDNHKSPNANETLPKREIIWLTSNYLTIRGIISDKIVLNDILDEEKHVSENLSIASTY